MIRELFHIGPLSVSPFGVTLVAAFVVAYLQLRWGLKRQGIGTEEDASAILFWAGLGGIVGGKVYYAILYGDWRLLFDRSGLVFYGGFLLAAALVIWSVRRRKLPLWPTLDATALALAPGYAVGRLGCFLVGDDYGVPSDGPWAVTFPVGLPPTTAAELRRLGAEIPAEVPGDTLLAVHPTQLYETGLALLILGLGIAWFKRRPQPGTTLCLVTGLLAIERFGIEFLRVKDDRFFGSFTLAQVLALAILVTAVALGAARRRRAVAA